jgi:hypothetical protein
MRAVRPVVDGQLPCQRNKSRNIALDADPQHAVAKATSARQLQPERWLRCDSSRDPSTHPGKLARRNLAEEDKREVPPLGRYPADAGLVLARRGQREIKPVNDGCRKSNSDEEPHELPGLRYRRFRERRVTG